MKYTTTCLIVLLLLVGCANKDKLKFDVLQMNEETCTECPKVIITVPKATEDSKISKTINTAVNEELISALTFDSEIEVQNLDDALASFNNSYEKMKSLYADESAIWEATIKGEVTFEDATLLTIALDSYIFTGGAHGYTSKRFLNFDKNKGIELENRALFSSLEKFEKFAELKFRQQEAIPENESINYTGLMFEQDHFYLPENIGFTKGGLKLLYNPYEIASFADGPIELVISHKEIENYLAKRPQS